MKKLKKSHQFILTVTTHGSKQAAKDAIQVAFALREPDDCEFMLMDNADHKKAWMDGAKAGTEIAFDLVEKTLENLRKNCDIKKS